MNSSTLTITPKQLMTQLRIADLTQDSLFVWGGAGIGKSESILGYANEFYPVDNEQNRNKIKELKQNYFQLKETNPKFAESIKNEFETFESRLVKQDTNFIDIRLSYRDPSDLTGIAVPVETNGETVVVWVPPAILKLQQDWKGVILFDELSSATPMVLAAAYQFFLDRKIGDIKLPKGAVICGAGNRVQDNGVTFRIPFPLADRMTHVVVEPNLDEWVEWVTMNCKSYDGTPFNPSIISFIKSSPEKFNTLATNPDTKSYAIGSTPRSWVKFNKSECELIKMLNTKLISKKEFNYQHRILAIGRLGNDVGNAYVTYVKENVNLPPIEEIINGVEFSTEWANSQILYMVYNTLFYVSQQINDYKNGKVDSNDFNKTLDGYLSFLDMLGDNAKREYIIYGIKMIIVKYGSSVFENSRVFPKLANKHRSTFDNISKG